MPGLHGVPEVIHSKEEAEIIRTTKLKANHTITAANHAFCTTRMSADPRKGVVNSFGQSHDVENLYIADTGNFAASPGVNPMLLCMAIADRIAHHISDSW